MAHFNSIKKSGFFKRILLFNAKLPFYAKVGKLHKKKSLPAREHALFMPFTELSSFSLVVEKPYAVKAHNHIVFVGSFDNLIVPDRTARLSNNRNAGLAGTLDVVSKREESV